MSVQAEIEKKLKAGLKAVHLEVINESHRHNVPAGSESHFKVVAVSPTFEKKSAVTRHREVYRLLDTELKTGVHALAMHLFTPAEWAKESQSASSPPCLGDPK